jgi:hypothetical protein
MPRALTTGVAGSFLQNYNSIRCPTSLSYNDNYCGAYLNDKTREYGFETWEQMAAACRKLLKISKPVKMVKIPASVLAEARNFVASMQNIVENDMSFVSIAERAEKLTKKLDAAKKASK